MLSHLDDLLCMTADEGASAPVGYSHAASRADLDLLMEAWLRERENSIEYSLCLDRAKRLILRILDDGVIPEKIRREALQMLLAIKMIGDLRPRDGV